MTIVLEKQRVHFPSPQDYDVDELVGRHRYVKNGVEVESYLQCAGLPYNSGHVSLFGSTKGKFKARFTFKDITKAKLSTQCYFLYIGGIPVLATWSLANSEGIKPATYDHNFTVPVALTFTKQ